MLLAGKRLKGAQKEQFREALDKAFDLDQFSQMLSDNMDKKVEDIIIPRGISVPDVLGKVIERAEQESWTAQLLQAALSKRHEDNQLLAFAQQFGSMIATPPLKELIPPSPGFESAVTPSPMYVLDHLMQRFYTLAGQICRIEDAGRTHLGTGFLVGANMIMTNYHVWEKAKEASNNFICRFDYGTTTENKTCYLAENYEVEISRYKPGEDQPNTKDVLPSPEELDYVLFQLSTTPGTNLVRHPYQEQATQRGWMTPYHQEYPFQPDTPLYILHYPQIPPVTLRVSLESNAIIKCNENKTRVQYKTNTAPGSSGAPCFTDNWELIALHHFGDLNNPPVYNQGIPFAAISQHLDRHGHKHIFLPCPSLDESASKGHEPPENAQPVSHPHVQDPLPAEELLHPTHLEAGVAAFSPVPQPSTSDKPPIDEARETSSETDKADKIIDIGDLRRQREARQTDTTQSFLQKARLHFESAQKFANDAYTPFINSTRPTLEQFRKAAVSLSKAKQSIQSLQALLFPIVETKEKTQNEYEKDNNISSNTCKKQQKLDDIDAHLPKMLQENLISINSHINTIVEQIEKRLIPSLNWNQVEDFSPLRQAMEELAKLLPEHLPSKN